jgi:hypothetical protein
MAVGLIAGGDHLKLAEEIKPWENLLVSETAT